MTKIGDEFDAHASEYPHEDAPRDARALSIDYAGELNEAQYKAVTHLEGPHLVIAGAGTGKTRTLVYRVAYLVERGIPPESILLLTFTRKASQEMMERASQILDARCTRVSGGTFHSFGNQILRKYAKYLGFNSNFTIVDRPDAEEIIGLIRTELGLQQKKAHFPKKEALMNIFSRAVNTGRSHGEILAAEYPQFVREEANITRVGQEYERYKQTQSIMDYDDLLVNLKRLLEEQETVRTRISRTYRFIMVDEYQDTNRLQAEVVKLLASEHQNVMAVGDDSQSIYSFRGANFRNIMDFPKLFPGCIITTLEQNYRSTQPILSLTNAIIGCAREKFSKELFSDIPGEQRPHLLRPKSEFHQARFVTQEVIRLAKEGKKLSEMAVLFRSGWHSNDLEIELAAYGIPFVKYGGIKFVEAGHIKDVLGFLRVAFNPRDTIAWRRILMLLEGIGGVTAGKVIRKVMEAGDSYDALVTGFGKQKFAPELARLHDLLGRLNTKEMSLEEEIRSILQFYQPYFETKYDDFSARTNDLESLLHIAQRYESIEKFLSDLTLEPPEQKRIAKDRDGEDKDHLVLSTIHSAKGLEWETVFLIHLVDGCLPSSYSLFKPESLEEERRLFYVAATRAKRHLYLMAPKIEGGSQYSFYGGPSRFLSEIPRIRKLTLQ